MLLGLFANKLTNKICIFIKDASSCFQRTTSDEWGCCFVTFFLDNWRRACDFLLILLNLRHVIHKYLAGWKYLIEIKIHLMELFYFHHFWKQKLFRIYIYKHTVRRLVRNMQGVERDTPRNTHSSKYINNCESMMRYSEIYACELWWCWELVVFRMSVESAAGRADIFLARNERIQSKGFLIWLLDT